MFKVVNAEIKKILSKPGIYILSILLAVILVLGIFIYKPTVYSNDNIQLNGVSVSAKYQNFQTDLIPKTQEELEKTINAVKYYRVESNSNLITHKENINNLLTTFENKLRNYLNHAYDHSTGVENYINNTIRPELVQSLKDLHSAVDTAINKANSKANLGSYAVLITESDYETYSKNYTESVALLQTSVEQSKIPEIVQEFENKHRKGLIGSINNLKYPNISDNTIKEYTSLTDSKLAIVNSRLTEIETQITNFVQQVTDGSDASNCNKMDELATNYKNTADTFINLVKYDLISTAFDAVSTNDQLNLLFLKNESKFNADSLFIRYTYLFKNNKSESDYAHPLTIGVTSNSEINAYDYAYFILRVFSFVIIVYAVMAACHTIAGEVKEGSMRYFAIRPVTRNNIYFGKMLSILLMSIIMILFSTIIALCVGGAVYGFNSLNILTIFNGSNVIVLNPIVMLMIYLLSFVLELIVYLSIAMMLSCLIKSDLFAVTLILVVYLINALLPMFVNGPNTWLTYYPFSHLSLYSLFGSTVYANNTNFFNLLFGVKVYAGTNIGLTITMIILLTLVFNFIAVKKFKNKEL